jgi:hypothetical protein
MMKAQTPRDGRRTAITRTENRARFPLSVHAACLDEGSIDRKRSDAVAISGRALLAHVTGRHDTDRLA